MGLFGIDFAGANWTRGGIESTGGGGYTHGSGGVTRTKFTPTEEVRNTNNKYAKYEQYDLKSPVVGDSYDFAAMGIGQVSPINQCWTA